MSRRRRSNRVRNTKAVTAPPASVTIIEDIEEDEYENHRSCWKHIAYLNTRDSKPKLTEEDFELFKVTAPCFYEECTRRERSRRRVKCKYLVSKLRKKLNSNIFINYLEVLWKKDVLDEKKNSFVIEGRSEDSSLVDDIPLHAPDVPQQTNDVECGSFVLYYIHRFIENACSFNIDSYPCFLKEDWFSHKDLEDFCNTFDSLGAIR
ncbi:hypothetical protein F2Q69_00005547 [Brassica cretica]|uniref:Ubiquitin-like protease family profile domain-containing protein n=1 Tax=Brassica cretica TaxID=69181 RepID=A0A8S9P9R2_BRACR|nr:hypothetical protein F2Q69_00005547 [Brassica cretica]